jgi:trans-2,3-dihydro-3-hydroxyanthranilate isomerase
MAQHRYVLVDVFTDTPLAGNPLAVFTDARKLDASTMGRIAAELNLSETSFVLPAEGEGDARVRIFTPRRELPFAGHPLCGTAWVMGRSVVLDSLRLETGAGVIPVSLERSGGMLERVVMTQPRPTFSPARDPAAVFAALRLPPPAFGESLEVADNGLRTALVPVASHDELRGLEPDLSALARVDVDCVLAWHFDRDAVHARAFLPDLGIAEDPATGSAVGPLAVQLVRRGLLPPGEVRVEQGAEIGRPSVIEAEVTPEGDVRVGGRCVVVGRGFLEL